MNNVVNFKDFKRKQEDQQVDHLELMIKMNAEKKQRMKQRIKENNKKVISGLKNTDGSRTQA